MRPRGPRRGNDRTGGRRRADGPAGGVVRSVPNGCRAGVVGTVRRRRAVDRPPVGGGVVRLPKGGAADGSPAGKGVERAWAVVGAA